MVEEAGRVQIKQPWGYCCNLYSILRVGFYVTLVTKILRRSLLGTSLVVQGLRLCLPMQGVQFPSLVGELRSHVHAAQLGGKRVGGGGIVPRMLLSTIHFVGQSTGAIDVPPRFAWAL